MSAHGHQMERESSAESVPSRGGSGVLLSAESLPSRGGSGVLLSAESLPSRGGSGVLFSAESLPSRGGSGVLFSAESLPSRGGSEIGSRYTVETGIYMSAFAATVFIAGLVTLGVSLLTLLIALAVMLQTCQTRNHGLLEVPKSIYDYDYCKIVAFQLELNGLDAETLPVICKDVAIQYITEGRYLKDLNATIEIAENYLSSIRPIEDGRDVVLMDLDDFLPADVPYPYLMLHQFKHFACGNCAGDTKNLKQIFIRNFYLKLRASGWRMILLSGRPERLRNATEKYLISAGCDGWSALVMRTDDQLQLSTEEYLSRQRIKLQREGFRIVSTISSEMDFLRGPCLGRRIFKLPNLNFYGNIRHFSEAPTD